MDVVDLDIVGNQLLRFLMGFSYPSATTRTRIRLWTPRPAGCIGSVNQIGR